MTNPSEGSEDQRHGYMVLNKRKYQDNTRGVRLLYYSFAYKQWWTAMRWTRTKTGLLNSKLVGFYEKRTWHLVSTNKEFSALVNARIV